MNATQGVILVMGSALVLWLMWSAQSPFAAAASGGGSSGGGGGGSFVPPPPIPPKPGVPVNPYDPFRGSGGFNWGRAN